MLTYYEHLYVWADEPERIYRRLFSTPPAAKHNRRARAAAQRRLEEAIAVAQQPFDEGEVIWFRIAVWKSPTRRRGDIVCEAGPRPRAADERPTPVAR